MSLKSYSIRFVITLARVNTHEKNPVRQFDEIATLGRRHVVVVGVRYTRKSCHFFDESAKGVLY